MEEQFLKEFEDTLPEQCPVIVVRSENGVGTPFKGDMAVATSIGFHIADMSEESQAYYDSIDTLDRLSKIGDKLLTIFASKYNLEW